MYTNDSNLKHYLGILNEHPPLSREREDTLLKQIEEVQNKILNDCVSSEFFKSELLMLLKEQKLSEIVNISRKLDNESSREAISKIKKAFKDLLKSLETKSTKKIQENLVRVSLSGTLVHELVSRINDKYSKISKYDRDLQSFFDFFEVRTKAELEDLIKTLKESEVARAYHSRKLLTTEVRLMRRAHEFLELEESLKISELEGASKQELKDIKTLHQSIVFSEKEMKRFRDELVINNLRLVVSRAKIYMNRGLDFEDLIQEGNLGLIRAVNKHDSSRGTKVATYATWWVDQAIRRAIGNKARTVRIPSHIEALRSKLSIAGTNLTRILGRDPTKEELAKEVGVDVRVIKRLRVSALHEVGLEEELNVGFEGDSNGISMMDLLTSDPEESPFSLTAKKLLAEKVRDILKTLPPRTEKIIRLRFGIGEPKDTMTLQQIADQAGLTKMGIRMIQNKGLERIKKKGILKDER